MTRITNLGRKRTHVEATFNYNESDSDDPHVGSSLGTVAEVSTVVVTNVEGAETAEDGGTGEQPPKKKRKRGPRKKAGTKTTTSTAEEGEGKEGTDKKADRVSNKKSKKSTAKSRTLQGSSPLEISACTGFTQTPSRTQRGFGKTTSQTNSRAERQRHLFCLPREGPCCTGLSQNRRRIHQTTRKPKRFQRDRGGGDLLSLRFTETPTLSLPGENL